MNLSIFSLPHIVGLFLFLLFYPHVATGLQICSEPISILVNFRESAGQGEKRNLDVSYNGQLLTGIMTESNGITNKFSSNPVPEDLEPEAQGQNLNLNPRAYEPSTFQVISDEDQVVMLYEDNTHGDVSFLRSQRFACKDCSFLQDVKTIALTPFWTKSRGFKGVGLSSGAQAFTMGILYLNDDLALTFHHYQPSSVEHDWEQNSDALNSANSPTVITGGYDLATDGSRYFACGIIGVGANKVKCFKSNKPADSGPIFSAITGTIAISTTTGSAKLKIASSGTDDHFMVVVQSSSTGLSSSHTTNLGSSWSTPIPVTNGPSASELGILLGSRLSTYSLIWEDTSSIQAKTIDIGGGNWADATLETLFTGTQFTNVRAASNFDRIVVTVQDDNSRLVKIKTCKSPTSSPSRVPTRKPTSLSPTPPTTRKPTLSPTRRPTNSPVVSQPTRSPSVSKPTKNPITSRPSFVPTFRPTKLPTKLPTTRPSVLPSSIPTSRAFTTNSPSVALSEPQSGGGNIGLIAGASAGGAIALLAIAGVFTIVLMRRKSSPIAQPGIVITRPVSTRNPDYGFQRMV